MSTSAGWTYPSREHTQTALGLPCQPCNRNDCPRDLVCLTDLPPELVFERLSAWVRDALGWQPPSPWAASVGRLLGQCEAPVCSLGPNGSLANIGAD